MANLLELDSITKSFEDKTVLQNVNLDIYNGEFVTLLRPSGY